MGNHSAPLKMNYTVSFPKGTVPCSRAYLARRAPRDRRRHATAETTRPPRPRDRRRHATAETTRPPTPRDRRRHATADAAVPAFRRFEVNYTV